MKKIECFENTGVGLVYIQNVFSHNYSPDLVKYNSNFKIIKPLKVKETITAIDNSDAKIDIPFKYTESVVPMINPVLNAFYAFSPELETSMNRSLYDKTINYLDYQARRDVLDAGLSDFTLDLSNGKFPLYMFVVLSTLDRISGSENLSLTKFNQHGLSSIDVLIDQESILGYPLDGLGLNAVDFYHQYLNHTNRFANPWASGVLTFKEFVDSNFMICINFEKLGITQGKIQLKLKFDEVLKDKKVLLWVPVVERKLIFDKNLDVSVD